MKPTGFHEGDRSEYLAEFALSTVGVTIPVPRQSDHFGTDFLVHIFKRRDAQVIQLTGHAFGIQIKSNCDDILISGEEHLACFYDSQLPFFLGVVNKRTSMLDVYTTMHRLLVPESDRAKNVILRPSGTSFGFAEGVLSLGHPVVSVSISDLDSDDKSLRDETRRHLRLIARWVLCETVGIVWRKDRLPWIGMPQNYVTNEDFTWDVLEYFMINDRQALAGSCLSLNKSLLAMHTFLNSLESALSEEPLSSEEKESITNMTKEMESLRKCADGLLDENNRNSQ